MTEKLAEKHIFYNCLLPKNWTIKNVDYIKSNEKYSCTVGPFGSDISSKYFVEEGVPVIRGGNLSLGQEKFITEEFVFISEEKARSFPGQHVKSGDLVFTCWGTLGQVGLIPQNGPFKEYIISNKQLKLRLNTDLCNSQYLYNYFSLPQMVQHINDIAIGSAVPGINLGLLKRIKVVLPPKKQQDKIAAILTAYDDLIENNKRRIAILEKLAEEIYREWFVRFRFPGYQTAEFEKGIPKGWVPIRFDSICKFEKGKNPNVVEEYLTEGLNTYINMDTLTGGASSFARKEKNSVIASVGDLLMLMDGSRSGLVFRSFNHGIVGSTLSVIRTSEYMKNFVYEYLRVTNEAIISNNTGSAIPHANKEFINRMLMFVPKDRAIIEKFNAIYDVQYALSENIKNQNSQLESTKRQLLPRLISGKLSVENLDIQFPPSMQNEINNKDVA